MALNDIVTFYQGDLTTANGVDRLFESVLEDFGHLDIVVNTLGKALKRLTPCLHELVPFDNRGGGELAIRIQDPFQATFFILQAAAQHVADDRKIMSVVTALLGTVTGSIPRTPAPKHLSSTSRSLQGTSRAPSERQKRGSWPN
ncbi:hypothetical protein N7470_006517 [Penicillium chermesinum]|nr:hypothetical protein N7470_006517 [Penicillium chermesinum]